MWTLGHLRLIFILTVINKEVMSKVFVSYKRVDKDKVFPLVEKLDKKLGIRCWVDLAGIESDEQFSNVIVNAINKCEVFLFMYSKAHENINPKKDWTVREITFADKKEKRIVFIDIDGYELPDWFTFRFPDQQVIKASDSRAMDKLADDMRNWLRLPLPNPSPIKEGQNTSTKDTSTKVTNHQSKTSEAINTHPQAIDLGLPSGTKWASFNVGATKPEEWGSLFAWGEMEIKIRYNWLKYKHCEVEPYKLKFLLKRIWIGDTGLVSICNNLGSDISGTKYDVAYMKWGENWRLPTPGQFKELLANCTHEWATLDGHDGLMLKSKFNDNSIFLPAAGCESNDGFNYFGRSGFYWSSAQDPSSMLNACCLYFDSRNAKWDINSLRCNGFSVRPVSK